MLIDSNNRLSCQIIFHSNKSTGIKIFYYLYNSQFQFLSILTLHHVILYPLILQQYVCSLHLAYTPSIEHKCASDEKKRIMGPPSISK